MRNANFCGRTLKEENICEPMCSLGEIVTELGNNTWKSGFLFNRLMVTFYTNRFNIQ